jgi:hypothetical protein
MTLNQIGGQRLNRHGFGRTLQLRIRKIFPGLITTMENNHNRTVHDLIQVLLRHFLGETEEILWSQPVIPL